MQRTQDLQDKMARRPTSSEKMVSVFVAQQVVNSENEAKKTLKKLRTESPSCVGGRLMKLPRRSKKQEWVVETYYSDDGGAPPRGMARMRLPSGVDLERTYGIVQ